MKSKFAALICFALLSVRLSFAQNEGTEENKFQFGEPEHLLDGYTFNFQYQNGTAIHFEFYEGKAKYEWVTGPAMGNGNEDIPYRSHKISRDLYLVNWHETGNKDYLTVVLDFERMIVHSSIIIGYENRPERTLQTVFRSGIIDHLEVDE